MNKYTEHNDNTLVDLIKNGDISAFEVLYDRHSSKVFKRCYFFCLNADEAKDLMQDVWIKVFFGINGFRKDSSFYTWIYTITTNHCLNQLKKKSRSELSINGLNMEIPYNNGKEVSAEVRDILSGLAIEDRALLVMKYMDELTYEEISKRLGLGASAVKMRLSRLIKKLRKEVRV